MSVFLMFDHLSFLANKRLFIYLLLLENSKLIVLFSLLNIYSKKALEHQISILKLSRYKHNHNRAR